MKFKENVDIWSCFEKALERIDDLNYRWRAYNNQPINDILELENEDWIKAIQLCKEFKKSPLKKEMELGYKKWLDNGADNSRYSVSGWLDNFTKNISATRRYSVYSNTNQEIKEQTAVVFKEHTELLNRFKELNLLFCEFNSLAAQYNTQAAQYNTHKVNYDNKVKQLETFRNLVNSGLQPQDFDWSLIEPQVEDEV
jgi:hypothetical protein